jgi:hypothetical protein
MLLVPPAILQMPQDSVRTELETMFGTDQKYRLKIQGAQNEHNAFSPEIVELWKKQNKIDQENVSRLIQIVRQLGWPKKSVVGEAAAKAAFLVLQHGGLELQQEYLPLFQSSAEAGEADLRHFAFLKDRVLVGEGKQQLYGTQLRAQKGVEGLQLEPIEDEANVDERRAKMGLGPLAQYLKGFGIEYRKPPKVAPNPLLNPATSCIAFRSCLSPILLHEEGGP